MVYEKQILIGVLLVILIIGVIVLLNTSHTNSHTNTTSASSKSSVHTILDGVSLSNPQRIPDGELPIDGRTFVIASKYTGSFLCDSSVMSEDINDAKIFTFDSKLNRTVNSILNNEWLSQKTIQLTLNVAGKNTLVGSYVDSCSNGTPRWSIMLGEEKNAWKWGYSQCEVIKSLNPPYRDLYSAVFYYV